MPPKDNPKEPVNGIPANLPSNPEILEIKEPKSRLNKKYLIIVSVVFSVLLLSGAAFALKIAQKNPEPAESANVSTVSNQQTAEVEDTAEKKSTEDDKKSTSEKTTTEPTDSQPQEQPHSSNDDPLNTIPINKYGGFDYYYAGGSQAVVASGASATFSQASPKVNNSASSHNHSLIEMAVQSSNGEQTVEVGWNVDPIMYGDSKPHLFVFHWVDGEGTCYDGCGFVQISDTYYPGDTVASGTTGKYKINHSDSKWNIYYNNEKVGYYPDSLWDGRFKKAGYIQVFGEVAKNSKGACIHMGNGILGSKSGSTKISNFTLLGTSANESLNPYATLPFEYGSVSATGMSLGGALSC